MNLNTHSSDVALFKLARNMALHERRLTDAAIANEHNLEGRDISGRGSHF